MPVVPEAEVYCSDSGYWYSDVVSGGYFCLAANDCCLVYQSPGDFDSGSACRLPGDFDSGYCLGSPAFHSADDSHSD